MQAITSRQTSISNQVEGFANNRFNLLSQEFVINKCLDGIMAAAKTAAMFMRCNPVVTSIVKAVFTRDGKKIIGVAIETK